LACLDTYGFTGTQYESGSVPNRMPADCPWPSSGLLTACAASPLLMAAALRRMEAAAFGISRLDPASSLHG
jgi:hypothetical protein